MKLRHGFVSNSSSSSFIIAYDKDKVCCPTCGKSSIDLLGIVETTNSYDGETELYIKNVTKRQLINYLKNREWAVEEEVKEISDKLKDPKYKNKLFARLSISYGNETLNQMISSDPNIEIVDSCG